MNEFIHLSFFSMSRQTDLDSQFCSGQSLTSSLEGTSAKANKGQDKELSRTSPSSRPSLRQRSPSPFRALISSSVPASPCSSPFKTTAPSPPPASAKEMSQSVVLSFHSMSLLKSTPTTSPTPCLSTAPPPLPSLSPTSSIRAAPPSSPTSSSFIRSPSGSSPISSSSVFTRSLAASCISQSISQSIARKNLAQQQGSAVNVSPHLRMRSPSPKPASCHQDSVKDDFKQLKCAPPSHWSSSPALRQSPTSCSSQHFPSMNHSNCRPSPSSPRQSCLHPRTESSQNFNNNNNNRSSIADGSGASVINCCGPSSPQKVLLTNGYHDNYWSGSHNRVPRPFSASEPNSRVQSPSPSPNPSSGGHLYSPTPQNNYSSMASKPPHPRSGHVACRNTQNPLGLTLEIPRASSLGLTCPSPQVLSPPPIGVSINVWTHNVAAPQPRNPKQACNSTEYTSALTQENTAFPTSSALFSPESCETSSSSPCSDARQAVCFNLQRSFSLSHSDTHCSPLPSNHAELRSCWQDNRQKPFGFSGAGQGSFKKHGSSSTSPRSEWLSHSSLPSCLSPLDGLESPVSSSRPPSGKSSHCGQHLTSVSWPDVLEVSSEYNGADVGESFTEVASFTSFSTPNHGTQTSSDCQTDWEGPTLQQDSCRTQLICPYVARPSQEQNLTTTPQLQVQSATMSPSTLVSSTLSPSSSPLPFSSSKQKNHKSSYATTINLQIAGSGKITSYSTAQVSLTQTLQGGAGPQGQGQEIRRVSVNGLSLLPPAVPQL